MNDLSCKPLCCLSSRVGKGYPNHHYQKSCHSLTRKSISKPNQGAEKKGHPLRGSLWKKKAYLLLVEKYPNDNCPHVRRENREIEESGSTHLRIQKQQRKQKMMSSSRWDSIYKRNTHPYLYSNIKLTFMTKGTTE